MLCYVHFFEFVYYSSIICISFNSKDLQLSLPCVIHSDNDLTAFFHFEFDMRSETRLRANDWAMKINLDLNANVTAIIIRSLRF